MEVLFLVVIHNSFAWYNEAVGRKFSRAVHIVSVTQELWRRMVLVTFIHPSMELFFSMQIHGIWLIVRKRTN